MFSKLEIGGLKSIRQYSFELAPLVLFTGLNSSGKSTTLQALRMLFSGIQTDDPFLKDHGRFEDLLHKVTKTRGKIERPKSVFVRAQSYGDIKAFLEIHSDNEFKSSPKDQLANFQLSFLSADRFGPIPYFQKEVFDSEKNYSPGSRGENLYACLNSMGEKRVPDSLIHENKVGYTLSQNLNAWISDIVADADIRLEESPSSLDVASITVDSYRQANVGFGISYTLSVITALLAASCQHLEKSGQAIVVAIENPEAHLHALGQTKMGSLLALTAMSGVQVLVETHSEYIVDGVRLAVKNKLGGLHPDDAVLYFFRKEKGESTVERINFHETGKLSVWPRGFFDQGRRNKAKLMED